MFTKMRTEKNISRFARDSLTMLHTPVSAVFSTAPKIGNATDVMLCCILGWC